MAKTIMIASGKGGSGKTMSSINFGLALNYLNHNVLVVDGNLKKPNLSLHFDLPSDRTMHDIEKLHPVDMINKHPSGLNLLFASPSIDDFGNLSHSDYSRIVKHLKDSHDFVIIDSGPNFSNEFFTTANLADEAIVVTKPGKIDIIDAKKTIQLCDDEGASVIGIIINIHGHDEVDIKSIEEELKRPVLGVIPEDENFHKSIDIGHPIVCSYPNSKMSKAFRKIGKLYSNWNKNESP